MLSAFEKAFLRTLKRNYRRDPDVARYRYNELGAVLFLGVGVVALIALLLIPHFPLKGLVYGYTAYCFLIPTVIKFHPPGLSLGLAFMQIPGGLAMIVSLQAIMPLDMVYLTAFLYPIVFIFAYEFHHQGYIRWTLASAVLATAIIIAIRELPYWQAYMVTTFGSTLIIGRVVDLASQRVQDLANRDSLTSLINRRYWEERVDHLVSLAHGDEQPVSLVFLDLDNFKRVNDTLGHNAGDLLLQTVARQLEKVCRKADLLARWGGDEFAIAMPNTNRNQAQFLVTRLRESLNEAGFSAGIVTLRKGETLKQLLSRADNAMYQEKSQRREL